MLSRLGGLACVSAGRVEIRSFCRTMSWAWRAEIIVVTASITEYVDDSDAKDSRGEQRKDKTRSALEAEYPCTKTDSLLARCNSLLHNT